MAFSDYFSLAIACLFGVLAMFLSDNQGAHEHQWLVPILWVASSLSLIFAVFRTRWFRTFFVTEESVSQKAIDQTTSGSNSPTFALGSHASVRDIIVNAPSGTHQQEIAVAPMVRRLPRVLEAVVQSPLYVEQAGYVIAQISIPGSEGLRQVISNGRYADLGWGTLERQDTTVPFRQTESNLYAPATVELRLVSVDYAETDPKLTDVETVRDSQAIKFFVKPRVAGIHRAEVELLADNKQVGSVPVHAEAVPSEAASGAVEIIARVTVTFIVYAKQYSIERDHARGKDQSPECGQGHSLGM